MNLVYSFKYRLFCNCHLISNCLKLVYQERFTHGIIFFLLTSLNCQPGLEKLYYLKQFQK